MICKANHTTVSAVNICQRTPGANGSSGKKVRMKIGVAGPFNQAEPPMKISARNVLKGKIIKVIKGATTSHILIDINGATVTSSITNEAVEDLKLKEGMSAYAIFKASDVMVGTD
jgi:molybdopterin-binding protein